MAVEVHFPGRVEFGELNKGALFFYGYGVYVKSTADTATVIYKSAGLMNAGELEGIAKDVIVQTIKDVTFKIGDVI